MKYLIFIALILIIFSCRERNRHSVVTKKLIESQVEEHFPELDTMYCKARINLFDTNIYFDIEITKIELIEIKKYFISKLNQYAVPDTFSGYQPVISFKLKNTNEKRIIATIPNSFELVGQGEIDSHQPALYHDGSGRSVHNYSQFIVPLNRESIDNKNFQLYYEYKPKEAKEFEVYFDPLPVNNLVVNFSGFHLENKPRHRTSDIYHLKEVWFLIDFQEKKVVGKSFPYPL
jgi:hypothetical protein